MDIFSGNGFTLSYNTDLGNIFPQSGLNVKINEVAALPNFEITSKVNSYETYDSEYSTKLMAEQSVSPVSIVVNYLPDDRTHQFLDAAADSGEEFQLVFKYIDNSESITYAIVNGVISSSMVNGSKDSVVTKSYTFETNELVARSQVVDALAPLYEGDYGVGSNGISVPQYEQQLPNGNSFVKIPSSQPGNPTGSDMMGIGLVDEETYSSIAVTRSGALSIFAKNQSTAWTRILTATQIAGQYVPLTRTINNKALSDNIVLDSTDTGSLAIANNLSDIPNKATARTNLEVYSSGEVDVKVADLNSDITVLVDNVNDLGIEIDSVRTELDTFKTSTDTAITTLGSDIDDVNSTIAEVKNDYVPKTTTINGHALSANVTLTAEDIGAVTLTGNDLVLPGDITSPEYDGSLKEYIDNLSPTVDAYTKTEADAKFVDKTTTVNGQALTGNVIITASDVDAYSKTESDSTFVKQTTTVNGQALSGNVTITAEDIDALTLTGNDLVLPGDITSPEFDGSLKEYIDNATPTVDAYTKAESDSTFVKQTTTVNGHALTGNITITASDVDSYSKDETDIMFVPKATTINGHALSGNVTVTKADVGLGNVLNDVQLTVDNNLSDVPDITDARNNLDVYSKAEVDAKGGLPIGFKYWHSNRTHLNAGTTPLDGQVVTIAGSFEALADYVEANEPLTTMSEWVSNPAKRGCFVVDRTSGTMRFPDYNGAVADTYGPMYLTGDSGTTAAGTMTQNAAPDATGNLGGFYGEPTYVDLRSTGVFARSTGASDMTKAGISTTWNGLGASFALSRSNAAYGRNGATRVKPDSVHGCYVIKYAGAATNSGSIDALAIDTDLQQFKATQNTKNTEIESRIGYALITTTTNAALNTRTVFANPFGNNTPVICMPEILHAPSGKWVTAPWIWTTTTSTYGIDAAFSEGEGIVLRTPQVGYVAASPATGTTLAAAYNGQNYGTPSPIRIHVWKVTQ